MNTKAIALALAVTFSGCCHVPRLPESNGPTVTELVGSINQAWAESRADIDALDLQLDSVDLTLQTKASTEIGGELEVLVLSAGTSQEVATSQVLGISLVEPPSRTRAPGGGSKLDVRGEIAAAIKRVAKAASEVVAAKGTDAGARPLALDKISASIGFDVTTTTTGGLQLQLGGIKIGPSATRTTSGSQEIELAFKAKPPKS